MVLPTFDCCYENQQTKLVGRVVRLCPRQPLETWTEKSATRRLLALGAIRCSAYRSIAALMLILFRGNLYA